MFLARYASESKRPINCSISPLALAAEIIAEASSIKTWLNLTSDDAPDLESIKISANASTTVDLPTPNGPISATLRRALLDKYLIMSSTRSRLRIRLPAIDRRPSEYLRLRLVPKCSRVGI